MLFHAAANHQIIQHKEFITHLIQRTVKLRFPAADADVGRHEWETFTFDLNRCS